MTLTYKDAIVTLLAAAVIGIWYTQFNGISLPLIGINIRWMVVILGVLGLVMAAYGAGDTLIKPAGKWLTAESILGIAALGIVLTGMITGASITVQVLAGIIIILWLMTMVRHALGF